MKRLLLLLTLLGVPHLSFAAFDGTILLGRSSFTASNEGPSVIDQTYPGTVLWGVVISSSMANGSIILYDSSATATNRIATLSLYGGSSNGPVHIPFEVRLSSGLTYTTSGNTIGVTIIYKRTRP